MYFHPEDGVLAQVRFYISVDRDVNGSGLGPDWVHGGLRPIITNMTVYGPGPGPGCDSIYN